MVSATSKVTGLESLRATMAKAPAAARAAMAAGLADVAQTAAADIRQRLAAEPGPVSPDPGRIADAVSVEPEADGTGVRLTVDLPGAEALEFGTRRMAARPFLRPAAAQAAQGAAASLARRLDEALTSEDR